MNQQFSVEYLGIKPNRYSRIPVLNTTGNHFFNLSQELQTSRARKNVIKPKLQALHRKEDSKNFYHHTTIYNVRVFKELGRSPMQPGQTEPGTQEQSFSKYSKLQTDIMVADFKKKVDALLSKNYRPAVGNCKITSSLKELESFQSTNNEEQLNKSLCSNKYTIRTEYKSIKAMEVLVIGNNKLLSRQIISSERIQQRLLKQMEQFLQDDRFNYDIKMQTMVGQYAEIVERIREQAYTIKIPEKYIIQMSDYNEYYQMKEVPQVDDIQVKLDIITDQIIQDITQSKKTTPRVQSQNTSDQIEVIIEKQLQELPEIIRTEPAITREEEIQQQQQIEEIINERKVSNRKERQKKKQNQNQHQQPSQQLEAIQSEDSSQSELQEASFKETSTVEGRRKKREQNKVRQEQHKIEEEELQDQFHAEVKVDQQIQQLNHKKQDFNTKFKPKTHSRRVTEDVVLERQDPIQAAVPLEQLMDTLSERPVEDCQVIEDVIRAQKEQLFQFQHDSEPQQQTNDGIIEKEQINIVKNEKPEIKIITIEQQQQQREAVTLWDINKSQSPAIRQRQVEISKKVPDLRLSEEIQGLPQSQNAQDCQAPETQQIKKSQEDQNKVSQTLETQVTLDYQTETTIVTSSAGGVIDYQKIINEKMRKMEGKLNLQAIDIFDILLASEIVYDVNIEKYKLGNAKEKDISNPDFIFQEEADGKVFLDQMLWRRELQQVIPRLEKVDKSLAVNVNEDYEQEHSNFESPKQQDEQIDSDDENY